MEGKRTRYSARLKLWPGILLISSCSLLLLIFNYQHRLVVSYLVGNSLLSGQVTALLPDWRGQDTGSQQWPLSDQTGGYWFEQTQDALDVMQSNYWNGTNWPTTIQWIGAFLDTLVASTDETLVNALIEYDGNVPGTTSNSSILQNETQTYFSQIQNYFEGEDTIQIFDAAYDDAQWVVLEWLEAIKFIKKYDSYANSSLGRASIANFSHRAHVFYNIVQDQFNTSLCDGGITWNPALAPYKNAITNELFIASSIAMYLYYPGDNNSDPYPNVNYTQRTNQTLPALPALAAHDPLLLNNAVEEYQWFKSHNFTNDQGLIVDGFHVTEGQTTCDQRNDMVYSYNMGVLLSGLRGLWEATGNTTYLDDGYNLINTTINATGWYFQNTSQAGEWAGLGRNGIMEDYCDAPANCSQDNLVFKGAYFHHLDVFCEPLPTSTALVPGVTIVAPLDLASSHAQACSSYRPWVEHNAYAALSTRNSSNIMGEWWGAASLNQAQRSHRSPALVSIPRGSVDVRNQPWVLSMPPWSCQDQSMCRVSALSLEKRGLASAMKMRRSEAQVRTVETQGQGLAILRCAADLTLKRPSG